MKPIADAANAPVDRRLFLAGAATTAAAALVPGLARAEEPVEIDAAGAGAGTEVAIESMAFKTPEVKCKVGDTVTWLNKDTIAHNVHFRQGPMKGNPKAQGKMLNQGEKYSVKFLQAGDYSYVCSPHPMMKGKVVVEA